jgi:hypothetical protein
MEALATYITNLLVYNLAIAFMLFAIVVFSCRKERSVTPLRGLFVFLIAWLGGTVLVFVFHLLFAVGGTEVRGGQLEMPIAIVTILAIAYAAHGWLSQPTIKADG